MPVAEKLVRNFVIRKPGPGRHIRAVAKVTDGYFSLTTQNGQLHDRILAHATPDTRKDLELLVRLHLRTFPEGAPMKALENCIFHMREGRFEEASARALAGAASPDEVSALHDRILARLANDPLPIEKPVPKEKLATAIPDAQNKVWREETQRFIDERCAPVWLAEARRGQAALSRPDHHADIPAELTDDRRTYAGFLATQGITLKFEPMVPAHMPDYFEKCRRGPWPGEHGAKVVRNGVKGHTGFLADQVRPKQPQPRLSILQRRPRPSVPSPTKGLERMQALFAQVEAKTPEEFLRLTQLDAVRKDNSLAEDAYNRIKHLRDEFVQVVGPDIYRILMTEVGPNPPLTAADFDDMEPVIPAM